MEPFFTAAADYAESRGLNIVMRRSDEGNWWAIVVLKDGYGRFEAPVHMMTPREARKASKKEPARDAETAEDFAARVAKEIDTAVVRARKTRIGISYSRAEDVSKRVAA